MFQKMVGSQPPKKAVFYLWKLVWLTHKGKWDYVELL